MPNTRSELQEIIAAFYAIDEIVIDKIIKFLSTFHPECRLSDVITKSQTINTKLIENTRIPQLIPWIITKKKYSARRTFHEMSSPVMS